MWRRGRRAGGPSRRRTGEAQRPARQGGGAIARGKPGPVSRHGGGEGARERADDEAAHAGRVAEAQLGLRRVHVHVDLLGGQVERQRHHRIATGGDHLAIADAHGGAQQRIGDWPAVHHQMQLRRAGAGQAGQRREAGQPEPAALGGHGNERGGGLGAEQRGGAGAGVLGGDVEGEAAVALQADGDMRRGQRQAAHGDHRLLGLDPRRFQEFAPRRGGEEQVGDDHARAGRTGGRGHFGVEPPRDADRVRVRRARRARGDGEPRGGADRRQRLAAEAEGTDGDQVVAGELRGGVPLDRERQRLGVHAGTVVRDLDPFDAAGGERDRDPARPGVERVLHQLLHRRRRPLDHLAGGDAADHRVGQAADAGGLRGGPRIGVRGEAGGLGAHGGHHSADRGELG